MADLKETETEFKTIYLDAPSFGKAEMDSVSTALTQGFVSTYGPFVAEFEKKMADYLNAEAAVSTQSGTAALHLALYALNLKSDDEVLVPSLTFIATANAVSYIGAKVILVDVKSDTWNIDLEDAAKKVTSKTRAIIPVHLLGNPCEIDQIERFSNEHNLKIIYDLAEALGSEYLGKKCGSSYDLNCFSFNGNKIITTGGGGLVTGSKETVERIRFLANQARDVDNDYFHPEIGFNYRMTNFEASLGLGQLTKLSSYLDKKKLFREIYLRNLSGLPGLSMQVESKLAKSSFWLNAVRFDSEEVMQRMKNMLANNNIQSRRMFTPLFLLPPYRDEESSYPHALEIFKTCLCLPSSVLNTEADINYVCKLIKDAAS